MKKFFLIFTGLILTQTACDLQPKVLSLPDSVGDFISARYPALLADPNTNPEIYYSAASDYGVYASPDLYGTDTNDDYVMYASVNDYIVPPQDAQSEAIYGSEIVHDESVTSGTGETPMYGEQVDASDEYIVVERGDTLYSLSKKYNTTVDDLARINNLSQPYQLSVGQRLRVQDMDAKNESDVLVINKPNNAVRTTTRVELATITVARGDTLYSLSRKYSVPVNDLAVMNKLTPPFNLSVGQQLRVPNLANVPVVAQQKTSVASSVVAKSSAGRADNITSAQPQKKTETKKISSDPSKKLPTISARSSSKFSWPVRGKILSGYGAKSNGLFNDGINISAKRGTAVKAAENGVVAYAGNEVKGMGNLIIIQHSGGWMTVYAHMDSMNVKRGNRVAVGQKIGSVGETGKVDSPQLHFEIRKGTKAYNPNTYLKK